MLEHSSMLCDMGNQVLLEIFDIINMVENI